MKKVLFISLVVSLFSSCSSKNLDQELKIGNKYIVTNSDCSRYQYFQSVSDKNHRIHQSDTLFIIDFMEDQVVVEVFPRYLVSIDYHSFRGILPIDDVKIIYQLRTHYNDDNLYLVPLNIAERLADIEKQKKECQKEQVEKYIEMQKESIDTAATK